MFHHRARDFDPPSAIAHHLRGIQDELSRLGRGAGRRGADSAAAAGSHIADAVAPLLHGVGSGFRRGGRAAYYGATGLGDMSSRFGSRAVTRLSDHAQHRPLIMLAVAMGVGVLIGAACRRSAIYRPYHD